MQTNGFIGKFQEKLEKILLPISEKLGEQGIWLQFEMLWEF